MNSKKIDSFDVEEKRPAFDPIFWHPKTKTTVGQISDLMLKNTQRIRGFQSGTNPYFDKLPILNNMRKYFRIVADIHMFNESLRAIYKTASNALEARDALRRWSTLAEAIGASKLVSMAKTGEEASLWYKLWYTLKKEKRKFTFTSDLF